MLRWGLFSWVFEQQAEPVELVAQLALSAGQHADKGQQHQPGGEQAAEEKHEVALALFGRERTGNL